MSSMNGDKSRFNRERKQKIARRKRTREMLNPPAAKTKRAHAHPPAGHRVVPA
jgi:hypothetical protein